MFDHTHKFRRLASLGAAVVTTALATPVAIADPPTIPSPTAQVGSPGLGEHLTGQDRAWLVSSSKGATLHKGDQLSGADRNWLTLSSGERPAGHPTAGFDWGDAGIGAGLAFAAIVVGAGGALVIRRRTPLAH